MEAISKPELDKTGLRVPADVKRVLRSGELSTYDVLHKMGKTINATADGVDAAIDYMNETGAVLAQNEDERIENEEKRVKEYDELKEKIQNAYDIAKEAADSADVIINGTADEKQYGLMMTNYAIKKTTDPLDSVNEYEVFFTEDSTQVISRYVHLDKGMKIRVDAVGGSTIEIKMFNVLDDDDEGNKVVTTGTHVMFCSESKNGILEYNVTLTGNYVFWFSDGVNYIIKPTAESGDIDVKHDPAGYVVVTENGLVGIHDAVAAVERRMNESVKQLEDDFDNAVKSIVAGGVALANSYGTSKVLGINQDFLTKEIGGVKQKLDKEVVELKEAIQALPDGQAVSATVAEHTTQLATLGRKTDSIKDGLEISITDKDFESGKAINYNSGVAYSNEYFKMSRRIYVSPGEFVKLHNCKNDLEVNALLAAFNGLQYVQASSVKTSTSAERVYIVPEGVDNIIITTTASSTNCTITAQAQYETYNDASRKYGKQTVKTTSAWGEVLIDKIPKGTIIVSVDKGGAQYVSLRSNASGTKQLDIATLPVILDFDAHYLVSSIAATVVLKYGDVCKDINELEKELQTTNNGLFIAISPNKIINDAVKDLVIYDSAYTPSDKYTIVNLSKTASASQIAIKKNGTYVANFWTQENPESFITIPQYNNSGITANAVVKWENVGSEISGGVYPSCINTKCNIKDVINAVGVGGFWNKKNALVIGDSLTNAGIWQLKLSSVLGMNVTTHAKGGIHFSEMLDGSGTLAPLNVSDVTGKDLIVIYGGYNHRGDVSASNVSTELQYLIDGVYALLKTADNLQCKIAIVTPHCAGRYSYIPYTWDEEYPVGSGRTGKTLVERIVKCAEDNHIACLNLFETSGINSKNWDKLSASSSAYDESGNVNDQLHLNNTFGYPYIGERIANWINGI